MTITKDCGCIQHKNWTERCKEHNLQYLKEKLNNIEIERNDILSEIKKKENEIISAKK